MGHYDAWHNALKGFSMIESPLIAELLGQAEAKAEAKAKSETLLRVMQKRYCDLSGSHFRES